MAALGWLLNLGFAGSGFVVVAVTPALNLAIGLDAEVAHTFTLDAETTAAVGYDAETAHTITLDPLP